MSVFVTTCVYFKHFCKMLDHWNDVKGFALIWQKVGLIGLTYTECKLRNWKHDSGDYVMVIHVVVALVKLISLGYLKNKLIISESMYETDICSIFSTERYRVSVFHQLWTYQNMQGKKHQTCAFHITILSNWIIHSMFLPQLSN